VKLQCPVEHDPALWSDVLVEAGAAYVTLSDGNANTASEVPLFSTFPQGSSVSVLTDAPAERGQTAGLWSNCTMEVGFAPDADVEGILLGSAAMAELSEAPRYHVESLAPRDWVTEVQRNWPPIAIADALTIRFPWHLASDIAEADASLPCITLHPGMAFGTGEHETTQLCVTELQRLLSASGGGAVEPGAGEGRVVGQTVLDYGSGSGILAFAALTFGAAARAAPTRTPSPASGGPLKFQFGAGAAISLGS